MSKSQALFSTAIIAVAVLGIVYLEKKFPSKVVEDDTEHDTNNDFDADERFSAKNVAERCDAYLQRIEKARFGRRGFLCVQTYAECAEKAVSEFRWDPTERKEKAVIAAIYNLERVL